MYSSISGCCQGCTCHKLVDYRRPVSDDIGAKFRRPNRKSGSPSKNLTSDLALEVAI